MRDGPFAYVKVVDYELADAGAEVAIPCDDIWLWMLSKELAVLVPTAFTTRMATMAINASTKPYSTSDCPLCFVFCINFFMVLDFFL